MSKQTRRDFLRRTGCAGLGAAALSAGFQKLGLMNLYAQQAAARESATAGYKALVCIFLSGGNDASNMVIPIDTTSSSTGFSYNEYSAARTSSGLAIPLGSVLPLNPLTIGNFGLHPSMPELATLFNQGKLGVVANVGPLVEPTTRTTYRNGTARRPYQLFSHSDQVEIWQSGRADVRLQNGWGGRTADAVLSLNGGSGFPVVTSVSGSTVFGQGLSTRPLVLSSGTAAQPGPRAFRVQRDPRVGRAPERHGPPPDDRPLRDAHGGGERRHAGGARHHVLDHLRSGAGDGVPGLGDRQPVEADCQGHEAEPDARRRSSSSGRSSLRRSAVSTRTRTSSARTPASYSQLSAAMKAFYDATVELGISSSVTTFTLSDFGRTLQPSGSGAGTVGTDHGWGTHVFVMGDAVHGGQFYGVPGPNGTAFPVLQLGGVNDADNRGRFVPTTAVDQYAATIASWFGLQPADMPNVFPNLSNFPVTNLGFV